jgi:orotate phosphoribosyltransferase
MGADPIAVATAVVGQLEGRRLSAFSVRKAAKSHGIGGRLVGPVEKGDRATVVEDTTTTGGALCEAVEVVLEAGLFVLQAVALVDRSGGAAAERLAALSVPYLSLVSPADLGVAG